MPADKNWVHFYKIKIDTYFTTKVMLVLHIGRAHFGGFHLDLLTESPTLEYASQHHELFISPTFQKKV